MRILKKLDKKIVIFFGLIILFQSVLFWISRYTVWPEMILYPYLLNNGFSNYRDLVNPYFPVLPLFLSWFFGVFGLSVVNLKILTLLLIGINQLIIFWSVKKIFGSNIKALISNLIYLMLCYTYGGNGLWFELALTPFLLGSLVLVLYEKQRWQILLAGALFGLAVGIKQNVALFLVPIIFLFIYRKKFKDLIFFLTPSVGIGFLIFIDLIMGGILNDFWFWAVSLTLSYSSQPGFVYMPAIRQYPFILFPLFFLVGLIWFKKNSMGEKIFFLLIGLLGIVFAFPRYEDFHLQFVVALSAVFVWLLPKKYLLVFVIILSVLFIRQGYKLVNQPDRFLDKQTFSLAEQIKDYKSVYLLNSPDLAYFLAGKIPAKPWGANFPWYFEQPGFEARFINGLKTEEINYVIIGDRVGGGKYDLGNYIPDRLLGFIYENYDYEGKFENFQIWRLKSIEGKEYASK